MSFNEFYKKEYRGVVTHLRSKLRNDETEAEDFAQNIFMKIFVKWNEIDSNIASPRTYLFAVVRNYIIDHYKSKTLGHRVAIEETTLDIEDGKESFHNYAILQSTSNPVEEMIGNEYKETFKKVINSLPILQKRCAIMYINGFKMSEIANRLNTTTGYICPMVRTLRQKFQKAYDLV
jgi:RNA polymerase sigma-70 factor (ECF subfamily)